MSTRSTYRNELRQRLGDTTAEIFEDGDLNDFLDGAVESLYPTYFQRNVDQTVAGAGPIQTAPTGARNIYYLGLKRTGSNRVRSVRNWREGDGEAYVPKTEITGQVLVWAWTSGWEAPDQDGDAYTFPVEAHELVILRAHVSALEALLSNRVKVEKYHALNVRPGITEDDILSTLEALHASIRERTERTLPLPTVLQ